MEQKILKRNEVEQQFKWAIEDVYESNEKWQEEYDQVKGQTQQLQKYKGRLGESGQVLYEYLSFQDEVSKLLERIYVYAHQKYHEDTTDSLCQNMSDKASSLMVAVSSCTSFATPEILMIAPEKIEGFYHQKAELKVYKTYIENIQRKRSHVLTPEIEELLANAGEMAQSPSDIFNLFNNADLKFPEITDEEGHKAELSHSKYSVFLQSKDRKVREEAFKSVYDTYGKFKNTLAATFSSNIKQESFFAKARKYNSTLEMAMNDSNVPVEVYQTLIDTVHENLHLMHRYVAIRKKALKLQELHMYDLYTPIVLDVDKKISFQEGKDMVMKGLAPLGAKYQEVLQEAYDTGWIDVYENVGKRSGAYSWGAYGTHPYILLNYQDNLNNVFTLAHEMGHAMHSYYSDLKQPYIYAGYKTFVAEVASTCNESLLMDYLLEHTEDKKEKIYLLNYYLEQFRTTLYRQTMFAEFEMLTHKMVEDGEVLTAENLCKIYRHLNKAYFGEDIVIDSEIDLEWARIPHFYNSFYVYQYATGYSAAIALSKKIQKEGQPAVDNYIEQFLSGGSSKDPITLLKGAGVDMSKKEPIEAALQVFEQLLDEIETLLLND